MFGRRSSKCLTQPLQYLTVMIVEKLRLSTVINLISWFSWNEYCNNVINNNKETKLQRHVPVLAWLSAPVALLSSPENPVVRSWAPPAPHSGLSSASPPWRAPLSLPPSPPAAPSAGTPTLSAPSVSTLCLQHNSLSEVHTVIKFVPRLDLMLKSLSI